MNFEVATNNKHAYGQVTGNKESSYSGLILMIIKLLFMHDIDCYNVLTYSLHSHCGAKSRPEPYRLSFLCKFCAQRQQSCTV